MVHINYDSLTDETKLHKEFSICRVKVEKSTFLFMKAIAVHGKIMLHLVLMLTLQFDGNISKFRDGFSFSA